MIQLYIMKFGKQLANKVYPDWRFYYLEYDKLKELIKERTDENFSEEDEALFVERLEKEVAKVSFFLLMDRLKISAI